MRGAPGPLLPLTDLAPRPLEATFIERPHRFMVRCQLPSGEVVEAHMPNPGRLTGTAAPGRALLLDGPFDTARRKLRYTCVAIREPSAWVGTVTTRVNQAFPLLHARGHFPSLAGTTLERAELKVGASRFDWALRDPAGERVLVECKSVTFARGTRVVFPDAVTARGARHLRELTELAAAGQRAAVVFLAQRGDVEAFEAARDIDPTFADALDEARAGGVEILATSLRVSPEGLWEGRHLRLG